MCIIFDTLMCPIASGIVSYYNDSVPPVETSKYLVRKR